MARVYWRELWKRTKEARPVLFILGGIAVSVFLGRMFTGFSGEWERALLYAGVILEIAGLGLVAYGLNDIRKRFRRESFTSSSTVPATSSVRS